MPKTIPGKLSVALIIASFLFLGLLWFFVALGQRGGATFFSNPMLAIPGLLAGVCGILAFFIGIISIIKNKERSILVFLATAIGFFILGFCLGEILFPH